jgi:UDP:flavonoid glycosyltransferase YjiC (YdhE family)
MKKKFLFTTLFSNDLGLLTRSLPIACELRERGHHVAFYNPARAPTKLIFDAGFDNILPKWPLLYLRGGNRSLSRILRVFGSRHAVRDLCFLASAMKHMKRFGTPEVWNIDHFMYLLMNNEDYARAEVDNLVDVINEHAPDAVVDFWNVSACIAARITRKSLITLIQADMHPQSKGFIWWREPPPSTPTPTPIINKILGEFHLKPVSKTADLLIGDRTLVVGMPETDPLPDTVDVTYIGAVLWQRPDEKLPDWVANLSTKKPIIWLYPGNPQYLAGSRTVFDSSAVIYACIEAFKDQDVQVVLSTGHQPLPKETFPLPANFTHAPFVPGLSMAERSDVVIHHGGYGSCQTGLYTGTPALVIPTYSERESNARRVAAVGAGDFVLPTADASGTKKRVDATAVRERVHRILSDSAYKENARRISEKLRAYGGARYAASLIEESI